MNWDKVLEEIQIKQYEDAKLAALDTLKQIEGRPVNLINLLPNRKIFTIWHITIN